MDVLLPLLRTYILGLASPAWLRSLLVRTAFSEQVDLELRLPAFLILPLDLDGLYSAGEASTSAFLSIAELVRFYKLAKVCFI